MAGILNAQNNIAASFPALDQYGPNTTLLLHGDGTNGAQNNTFLDSSANNFTITRNGNTTQGTFSPFSQPNGYWSNYFNGSSAIYSSSAPTIGTNDFTYEMWFYPQNSSQTAQFVFTIGTDNTGAFEINFNRQSEGQGANKITLIIYGSYVAISSISEIQYNQWTHVAFVRISNVCSVYVNGKFESSATLSYNINNTTRGITIGRPPLANNNYFTGYLSNIRLIVGTGIYTSNFTPSTIPLTAITNTQILTCQSNYFKDNSTNNYSFTVEAGTPSVQAFKPFSAPTAYYPAVNGGAGYFDGSGDYLTAASNSAFNFGSGDATIEGWVYPTASGQTAGFTDKRSNTGNYSQFPQVVLIGGTLYAYVSYDGSSWAVQITGSALPVNAWTHFALVRNGNTWTLYINGAVAGTPVTSSGSVYTGSSALSIGASSDAGGSPLQGYLSNVRLVKGTAVYTSTFTPPTAPLTAITNTSLLLSCTNAGIIDSVSQNQLETVGNAQISTTQSKFGGASMYFDGASSVNGVSEYPYISGTGDFTAEFWVYPSSLASYNQILATTSSGGFGVLINSNGTISYTQVGVAVLGTSANSVASGVWSHVAVARSSGVIRIFVNGNQGYSGSDTTNFSAYPIKVGRDANASSPYTGYVDDLRITKGIARYTQNFTPPQNAFPNYGPLTNIPTVDPNFKNTTLLLHGNGTNGAQNNTFLDSSTNNFTITRNGNTTQGTFTPFSQPNGWWSNYFDGTGNSVLTLSNNAAFNLSSGSFTIEAWINPFSNGATYKTIASNYSAVWEVGLSGQSLYWWVGGTVYTTTITVPYNSWSHIAISSNGTNVSLFINGILDRTVTATPGGASSTLYIGKDGTTQYFPGYISNFRIVKGTQVYTSNFTPSSLPLTAITNTSLLTCQSNRFVDNSSNAFAITAGVTTTPQNFYPFFPPLDYSTAAIGGSAYLDGSGDYLSSSVGAIGTGDFTVEFYSYWDNTTTSTGGYFQISTTSGGLSTTYTSGLLAYSNSGTLSFFIGSTFYGTTYTIVPKQWIHIAIVRSSGTVRAYVNGVSVLTPTTDTTNISATYLAIGGYYSTSYLIPGYLSNFRVLIGTALYTSNFTPPTAPLTAITNTSFLLSATNAGIIDNASKNMFETVGTAQISTTQSKFGGSSIYLNGSGNYLLSSSAQAYDKFGTADFTVEYWIYLNSSANQQAAVVCGAGTVGYDPIFGWVDSSALKLYLSSAASGWDIASAVTIIPATVSTGVWYHVAVTRNGSTFRTFCNGVQQSTFTSSASIYQSSGQINIGRYASGYPINAYFDDIRITNGVSRYNYNFTPPAAPFPNK